MGAADVDTDARVAVGPQENVSLSVGRQELVDPRGEAVWEKASQPPVRAQSRQWRRGWGSARGKAVHVHQ